ncbi:MAG TPA: hypothetical protein VFU36_09365, partial [Jatrophihabitans sp.]|nr:hypothetical protein [Jatrophihabitans sp.]
QLATPADLLGEPADAFVAGFVGRDRGYRALGFRPVTGLPTREEQTVRLNASFAGTDNADGWLLVVDDQNAPQGWLRADEVAPGSPVTEQLVHRGGTLATDGGSLRAVLDACLSSPTGRGVVVDADGRLVGSITASEVLALIEGRSGEPALIEGRSGEPAR